MALKFIPTSLVLGKDFGPERLSRTFGAPTSGTTWTMSVWLKLGRNTNAAAADTIFGAGGGAGEESFIQLDTLGRIEYRFIDASSTVDQVNTRAVLLDHTAWYHLVVRYDSTEVTDSNRVQFWLNGLRLTDFSATNWPALDAVSDFNASAISHEIGRRLSVADDFDGYMADFFFCDGQALSATDFGEQNGATWQPITPSVTFGNNGFLLEFATAAALGDDTSGNVNDWTQVNLDTSNQREDTPTQNNLTFNQDYYGAADTITLRDGSLRLTAANTAYVTAAATAALPKTGKYYWEVAWSSGVTAVDKIVAGVIIQNAELTGRVGDDNYGWGLYNPSTTVIAVRHDGGDTNFTDAAAFAVSDFFSVAYDADTGKLWFGREGTWLDSGDPELGTNPAVTLTAADLFGGSLIPACSIVTSPNVLSFRATAEFFAGTVPNGFKALRVDQWPKPPITDPTEYFDTIGYAGDSVNPRSLTGLQFQPDLAWVKSTSDPTNHILTNSVVGGGVIWINNTGAADAPTNPGGDIAALISDGITVHQGTTDADVNATGEQYVGIFWKEDPASGLDVVGYAGTAAAQAVNHDLGEVPDVMYVRNRDSIGANTIYHGKRITSAGVPIADPETDYLEADTSISPQDSATRWNDVAPTDTQFTVGTDVAVNEDASNHMAMLWTEIEGFSKFTSYNGTGAINEQTPFIYCGFRPKIVFIKKVSPAEDWVMFLSDTAIGSDTAFIGGTRATDYFEPNQAGGMLAPAGGGTAEMCASGFKLTESFNGVNNSTGEYMVMAFAEVPFTLASAFSTENVGAGAIDLNFVIDATGDDPNQFGDGAPNFGLLISATGTGGLPKAAAFPDLGFQINATGSAPTGPRGAGAITLSFGLDSLAAITGLQAVAASLPALTSDGTLVNSVAQVGAGNIPKLVVNGVLDNSAALTSSLALRMPILQTSGDINPIANAILPTLAVDGTVLGGTTLRAPALVLPQLIPSGAGISPIVISGSTILPRLQVVGTLVGGATFSVPVFDPDGLDIFAQTTLPALEANGFLLVPQEMVGIIALPALDVGRDAILAPGALITGSVTLPLQRLVSVVINGAAVTGTVWSMNTETLETANYLNFDFDSLVSFADQPYGVTSAGIFLLEGADDDGTNIDARMLTGISDRGDENLKEASHMYMQYEGQGMMFQLLPDGQQRLREYKFERRSNSSGVIHARAKGSRGLRSRSWQMGLRNLSGGDFTLDKLGLLLRQLTRKTRKN